MIDYIGVVKLNHVFSFICIVFPYHFEQKMIIIDYYKVLDIVLIVSSLIEHHLNIYVSFKFSNHILDFIL